MRFIFTLFFVFVSSGCLGNESQSTISLDNQKIVEGKVILPSKLDLNPQNLEVTLLRFSEAKIDKNSNFSIPMVKDELSSLEIYLPENNQEQTAILLSTLVFPNERNVTLDVESTAVESIYSTSIIYNGKLIDQTDSKIKTLLANSIPEFIQLLDRKLSENPYFLNSPLTDQEYVASFKQAIQNGQAAIKKAVETGELKLAKTIGEHHAEHQSVNELLSFNLSKNDQASLESATNGFFDAFIRGDALQLETYFSETVNFLGVYSLFSEDIPRTKQSEKKRAEVLNAYQNLFNTIGKERWYDNMKKLRPSVESSVNNEYQRLQKQGLFRKKDIVYDLHFREMLKGERRGLAESQLFVFRKTEHAYKIVAIFSDVDFF